MDSLLHFHSRMSGPRIVFEPSAPQTRCTVHDWIFFDVMRACTVCDLMMVDEPTMTRAMNSLWFEADDGIYVVMGQVVWGPSEELAGAIQDAIVHGGLFDQPHLPPAEMKRLNVDEVEAADRFWTYDDGFIRRSTWDA